MTQHRKARGMRTQLLVANYLRENGWPHASPAGEVLEDLDVSVVVIQAGTDEQEED